MMNTSRYFVLFLKWHLDLERGVFEHVTQHLKNHYVFHGTKVLSVARTASYC